MKTILRLKHWQVFLCLMTGLVMNNLTIVGNPSLTALITIVGALVYFAWPLLVGHALYNLLPEKIDINYNFFMINSFIWIATYLVIMVFSDGQGMSFTGIAALPGFYVVYAFLYFLAFPMKTLKSIEVDGGVHLSQYIGDFFLVLFLPLGIWFLQPRINRVAQTKSDDL